MGHRVEGEVYIPLEDWSEFVLKYAPKTSGEVALGPPRREGPDIVVPYAANTECHPLNQSTPPEWAKK